MKMFLVYDGQDRQHKQRIEADSAAVAAKIFAYNCLCYDEYFLAEAVVATQSDIGEGDGEVFAIEWIPKAVRR